QDDSYSDKSALAESGDPKILHKQESALIESKAEQEEDAPADKTDAIRSEGERASDAETTANQGGPQDFLSEMKALGYTEVDDLVALKTHGIGSDFVREMNSLLNKKLSA